jgi:hypothetical protein
MQYGIEAVRGLFGQQCERNGGKANGNGACPEYGAATQVFGDIGMKQTTHGKFQTD